MALSAVLDDLDSIEEGLKSLYVEKDGKFYLDLDDTIRSHSLIVPLANSMANTKRERDQARKDLAAANKRLEGLPDDFDPDEYARLKADEETRRADPDNKDVRRQIDTAVATARSQEQAKAKKISDDLDAEKKAHEETKASLRRRLVDDDLNKALVEAGVTKPSFLKAAKAMLAPQVEVVEEDGELVSRMISDLGGDLVARYVSATWVQSDDGKAFVEPAKGGDAGGNNRTTRGNEQNPWSKDHWNLTAQGQILKTDRAKAERLAKAAGKPLAA